MTNGTTASPTVEIFGFSGDGTLALVVGPGTAVDALGNATPETGPSASFVVDTTPPAVTLGPPSVDTTATGPVTFPITYSGATAVTLTLSDVVLVATGTATGAISLAGDGLGPYTVTVSNIAGTGTLAIALKANTARDALNNRPPAAGPGPAVTVEPTGCAEDINRDGVTNALDIQRVVNAVLGLT